MKTEVTDSEIISYSKLYAIVPFFVMHMVWLSGELCFSELLLFPPEHFPHSSEGLEPHDPTTGSVGGRLPISQSL